MVFASILIWYHIYRQTHTGHGSIDWHAHACYVHTTEHNNYNYMEWITCWYKNVLYRGSQ